MQKVYLDVPETTIFLVSQLSTLRFPTLAVFKLKSVDNVKN